MNYRFLLCVFIFSLMHKLVRMVGSFATGVLTDVSPDVFIMDFKCL